MKKVLMFTTMFVVAITFMACDRTTYQEEIGRLSSQATAEYEKINKYDDVAVDNLNKKYQELETKINQKCDVKVKTINFKTLPKLPSIDFDGYKIGSQFKNNGYKNKKFKKIIIGNIISYSVQIDMFDTFDIFTEKGIIIGIMKNYQGRLIDLANNINTKYNIKFKIKELAGYPIAYSYKEDDCFMEINMDQNFMTFDSNSGGYMGTVNLVICENNLQSRINDEVNREKSRFFNM